MTLSRVEIRNYRCFTNESPLVIPVNASVIAFVGPNNAGKTAALKAFYELRPLWQQCLPPALVGHYGKNQGIGGFLVKDQSEVHSHDCNDPLSIDWIFDSADASSAGDAHIQRIRVWVDQTTQAVRTTITLASGQTLAENAALAWHQESESLTWPGAEGVSISGMSAAANRFASAKFVPAVRSAATSSQGVHYEAPQGIALASEWSGLKTGDAKSSNNVADAVESTLERLFGFERLQINVTAGTSEFSVKIGHRTYRLNEIGNGFSQLLYLAIDTILRPASLLLVDEPEAGLHPGLQRELLSFLAERSSGNLYFATHSVGLARSFADQVIAIYRHDGVLEVKPMEALTSYSEWLGELSFSTWNELGFEAVLLVEGPTELRAFPHLLRLLKLDGRVMLQSLGGSNLINGNSAVSLGEYKRLNCRVFVLIDSEKSGEGVEVSAERMKFVAACKEYGYSVHVLHRRAFDNYLTEGAVKKAGRGTERALAPFEKMVADNPGWAKSKVPAIVQQMSLVDFESTDLGKFLADMKDACR